MNKLELQIEILSNVIGGLYKDLADLKSNLIIVTKEKEALEMKLAPEPIEEQR